MATVNLRGFFRTHEKHGPIVPGRVVQDLGVLGIVTTSAEVRGELEARGYVEDDAGGWMASAGELEQRLAIAERLAADAVQAAVNMKGEAKDGARVRALQAVDDVRRRHSAYQGIDE